MEELARAVDVRDHVVAEQLWGVHLVEELARVVDVRDVEAKARQSMTECVEELAPRGLTFGTITASKELVSGPCWGSL